MKKIINLELSDDLVRDFEEIKSIYSRLEHYGKMTDDQLLKLLIELEHFKLFKNN